MRVSCTFSIMNSIIVVDLIEVKGVAELNGNIYLALKRSNRIRVYTSSPPFNRLDDIVVKDLKNRRTWQQT